MVCSVCRSSSGKRAVAFRAEGRWFDSLLHYWFYNNPWWGAIKGGRVVSDGLAACWFNMRMMN
jgi:hypothetical protein